MKASFLHRARMTARYNRTLAQNIILSIIGVWEITKILAIIAGVVGIAALLIAIPILLIGGFYGAIFAVLAKTFLFVWNLII